VLFAVAYFSEHNLRARDAAAIYFFSGAVYGPKVSYAYAFSFSFFVS
jgi:hypothetical protein